LVLILGIFGSGVSQARVFDMNREKFAAYLKAQYAPTTIKKSGFEAASNNNETYNAEMTTLYGGEFGFIYSTRFVGMRFGLEVIRPPTLKVTASDASGATPYYDLASDVSVVIPKVGLEIIVGQWKESRIFLNANYGQGNLGMVNSYTFTAAGTAATGGMTDYTEDGRGSATNIDGSLGLETLLFDTTTLAFEAGYRTMSFSTINHNRDVATGTLAQAGAITKGTQMLNANGSARTLDFTGPFVNLMFRFWVN
jgi:hypothetical protein